LQIWHSSLSHFSIDPLVDLHDHSSSKHYFENHGFVAWHAGTGCHSIPAAAHYITAWHIPASLTSGTWSNTERICRFAL